MKSVVFEISEITDRQTIQQTLLILHNMIVPCVFLWLECFSVKVWVLKSTKRQVVQKTVICDCLSKKMPWHCLWRTR